MLSIIVPVLNEAALITSFLEALQSLRQAGHEIIVVDGGSTDATMSMATPLADKVIPSEKGSAIQMNAGAAAATGDVFVFIHVDTHLPDQWLAKLTANSGPVTWGFYKIKLDGKQSLFRIIEYCMNVRSRFSHVATGDQCLFVGCDLFNTVKGFPQIALMEDVAICKLLRKREAPVVVDATVITSSRRWEQHGILKTVLLMWRLRLLYFLGVSPASLARTYYNNAT